MAQARGSFTGYKELADNCRRIAQVVGPPSLAESMATGAQEILWQAQLNVMTQGLYESGALHDSGHLEKVNQYRVDVVFGNEDVPYAAVHEYGHTQKITPRQRGFFWYKFRETAEAMWKALALSETYTIPARPYLRPAFDEQWRAALLTVAQSLGGKIARAMKTMRG